MSEPTKLGQEEKNLLRDLVSRGADNRVFTQHYLKQAWKEEPGILWKDLANNAGRKFLADVRRKQEQSPEASLEELLEDLHKELGLPLVYHCQTWKLLVLEMWLREVKGTCH